MDTRSLKLLGGIGVSLTLLSWLPYIGFLLALAGVVLTLITFKKISDYSPERKIFKNFVIGTIFSFFGGLVLGYLTVLFTLSGGVSSQAVFLWILMFGFTLLSGHFYKLALQETSIVLEKDLFKTGGNLIFWGSVFSFAFLGFILIWIGWLVVAIAFFSLQERKPSA